MHEDHKYLLDLADRIDRGASSLAAAGNDPRGTLESRGYHLTDEEVAAFGARKEAAAVAARQYAQELRGKVRDGFAAVSSDEAEKVATAAECDGILIDGSRLTESAIKSGWHDEAGKQALRDHQAAEDAAVRGSGVFEHVAETIDGVEQVPYWQLGHVDRAQDTAAQAGNDHDDVDGM